MWSGWSGNRHGGRTAWRRRIRRGSACLRHQLIRCSRAWGECRAEVVISSFPVPFPFVTTADLLVALSQSAYDRYLSWTAESSGVVFYDTLLVSPAVTASQRHIGISATQSTEEVLGSRLGANIVMLAAVVEVVGPIGKDSLVKVVSERSPGRFRDRNLRAAELGFSLGSRVSKDF